MPRDPAYDSFRKLGDQRLFELAQALVDPDALRRTNLIEFSDLTSVSHQIVTEVRSLGSGGWPGYVPKTNSSDDCRGFVFLGFLRRGMPVQHTKACMVAGDKSIELTRMDEYTESSTLALLLLDTVWRRCMKSEREGIPRPFWLGDGSKVQKELPMNGAPPGDLFWQEFLGIRGRNLNPDWELFLSRCELSESAKACRLWRDGRGQGESKWSEERALLAKLCSRLAFSYLSLGWLPQGAEEGGGLGDDRVGDLVLGEGPFKVEFEFQERVLKSQEQVKRIKGLRRRASRTFEESAWAGRERERSTDNEEPSREKRFRDRDLRRLASVPETYLGLLDPALDNPDQRARRTRRSESALAGDGPEFRQAAVLKYLGVIAGLVVSVLLFRSVGSALDPSLKLLVTGVLVLLGLSLASWVVYLERSPSRGLGPSTSPGRKLKTLVAYLAGLAVVIGTVAVIGDAPLLPFVAVPLIGLLVCLFTGVFPRPVYWLGGLLLCLVGLVYLMPGLYSALSGSVFAPWDWGDTLGFPDAASPEPVIGLPVLGLAAFLLSADLAFVASSWRQETVVLPTWSGSGDWNVHEIRTPPEFSVWQGIIARPSRRNRGWRTRVAVEIGRKAHIWWSDPSDRGHVPNPVPDRPQLLILELRARMSGTITIIGSALSISTAAILLGLGLIQLGPGLGFWGNLQDVGGDAVTTILLLVPTLLGALLIRPGEEPIAGQLLRVDRLLVLFGAIVPASIAAAALLFFGWPESPVLVTDRSAIGTVSGDQIVELARTNGSLVRQIAADQSDGFWQLWICLGTLSLVAGFTLFLSWLDARKIDRPEPFNRQQGLPVSEPRRRNLDYPGPLPPLESVWGRVFARRSLLRISPRRSLIRSRVSTTYSLVLPAEGSRVYTPAAPTILCLLAPSTHQEDSCWGIAECDKATKNHSKEAHADWRQLESRLLSLIGMGDQPSPTRAGLTTNILEWDPAASLSLVAPRYLSTGYLPDDERFLTTLLRLQRANSRPNQTKPVGGGGGLVLSQLPKDFFRDRKDLKPFLEGGSWLPASAARHAMDQLLNAKAPVDAEVVASPTVALLGLDPAPVDAQGNPVPVLDLPNRTALSTNSISKNEERFFRFRRLIRTLDRAGMDFDALVLVDPNALSDDKVSVRIDRWATRHLSACAADLARQAGRGPGAHVWPSSFEPPLSGEGIFPFWPGDHGDRIQLGRRILLRDWRGLRSWRSLRLPRRFLFTRWTRTVPVGVLTSRSPDSGVTGKMFSRTSSWDEWVRRIPRALDSRPPLAEAKTFKDMTVGGPSKQEKLDEFKVALMSGNIASGKSWMMHKLRPRLATSRGEEWDAVRVDSANNFFFAIQDSLEGDEIDTRTTSYHLNKDLGELALAYQDLIQKTFLIEAWDVLRSALAGASREEQAGVFVEYWPAFSASVMSVVFLNAYGRKPESTRRKDRLARASDDWNAHVLPKILTRVSQVSPGRTRRVKWQMIHLDPGDTSELEKRVRLRGRRNEEMDRALIVKTQKRLEQLYVKKTLARLGAGISGSDVIRTKFDIRATKAGQSGQLRGSPQWPKKGIFKLNPGPRPTGKDLEKVLDRLIGLL